MSETAASVKVEKDRSKFDWVAQRSACSLPKVFKTLMAEVTADVKERNVQRPASAPYEFSVLENGNEFSVLLDAPDFHRSIAFCLEEHAIIVRDSSGNQMFEVTLIFTEDGRCRMKAKEENRESWQVRRMALEDLMFRTV